MALRTKRTVFNIFISIIVIFTSTGFPKVETVAQQVLSKTLFDDLMANYTPSILPVCDTGGNVTLRIDLGLRQILDVNEREQVITTNVWVRLTWNDCRLTWDPNSYNNLSSIMLTYTDVWMPDITLYDSAAEEVMFPGIETYRAYVSNTGSVTYNFPSVLKSVCRVNVKYFPFDIQECSLQFGSWAHHGLDLDIVNKNPEGDIKNYIDNAEWTVDEMPVKRHVLFYGCCPEPFPDVTFYVVMKRRPAFYLLTMIFPCILTSCVAALTFLLPVESGEKVSLEITVLLSLAVFLLLVSESLPPSSDNFPVIGSYFASSMVLVSLSLLQTVIVLNVFFRGTNGRAVPGWARKIFIQGLGRILCIKTNRVQPKQHDQTDDRNRIGLDATFDAYENSVGLSATGESDNDSGNVSDDKKNHVTDDKPMNKRGLVPGFLERDPSLVYLKEQTEQLKSIANHFESGAQEDVNNEWREISNVLDRLFLVLYLLITVITTLSFILQCLQLSD